MGSGLGPLCCIIIRFLDTQNPYKVTLDVNGFAQSPVPPESGNPVPPESVSPVPRESVSHVPPESVSHVPPESVSPVPSECVSLLFSKKTRRLQISLRSSQKNDP